MRIKQVSVNFVLAGIAIALAHVNTGSGLLAAPQTAKSVRPQSSIVTGHMLVKLLAISPEGDLLATGGTENVVEKRYFKGKPATYEFTAYRIRIWRTKNLKLIRTLEIGSYLDAIAFTPNGEGLVVGTAVDLRNALVQFWDLTTGRKVRTMTVYSNDSMTGTHTVGFAAEGNLFVVGGRDEVARVWGTSSWKLRRKLPLSISLKSIAFSPGGRFVASQTWTHEVKLWDTIKKKAVHTLRAEDRDNPQSNNEGSLAFSPDSKLLAAAATDRSLAIFDRISGKALHRSVGQKTGNTYLAFSPTGKIIAVANSDSTVKLWNVRTGSELLTCNGHRNGATAVVFFPDGKKFATAENWTTVRLWNVPPDLR